MGRNENDDADEADLDEREWPDESDVGDEEATSPCPFCGKAVWEQADVCPHCRNFISFDGPPRRKPWWILVGAILGLLVAAVWAVFG